MEDLFLYFFEKLHSNFHNGYNSLRFYQSHLKFSVCPEFAVICFLSGGHPQIHTGSLIVYTHSSFTSTSLFAFTVCCLGNHGNTFLITGLIELIECHCVNFFLLRSIRF